MEEEMEVEKKRHKEQRGGGDRVVESACADRYGEGVGNVIVYVVASMGELPDGFVLT
jgi:hypothetical protein